MLTQSITFKKLEELKRYYKQCCGSKYEYIEFGSGSKILAPIWIRIRIQAPIWIQGNTINFKRKNQNNFREK